MLRRLIKWLVVGGFVLRAGVCHAQMDLPPLPWDRLHWYYCETLPMDEPGGFIVRISRDYYTIIKAHAELYARGDFFSPTMLLGTWVAAAYDLSGPDTIHNEVDAPGFHFEYFIVTDPDRPDLVKASHVMAQVPRGSIDTDVECW